MRTETQDLPEVDGQIGVTLRALLAQHGVTVATMAIGLGMSKSALYERLACQTRWSAHEVKVLARYFGVPVTHFYDGIPGMGKVAAKINSDWKSNIVELHTRMSVVELVDAVA